MTEEIWKDIEGYELYKVSNQGRVKRVAHYKEIYRDDIQSSYSAFRQELILKSSLNQYGYSSIKVYHELIASNQLVHRLVAKAFLPNHGNKPTVNHINGVKDDNRICNLEWSTGKEQTDHANQYNLVASHLRMKKVLAYDIEGHFIEEFQSMKDAERALGVLQARISEQCRGITKTHCKGYFFEYSNS